MQKTDSSASASTANTLGQTNSGMTQYQEDGDVDMLDPEANGR